MLGGFCRWVSIAARFLAAMTGCLPVCLGFVVKFAPFRPKVAAESA
jgi:hypothetical protein